MTRTDWGWLLMAVAFVAFLVFLGKAFGLEILLGVIAALCVLATFVVGLWLVTS